MLPTITPLSFIFTYSAFSLHFVQSLLFFTLHSCSEFCRSLKSFLRGNKDIPVTLSRGTLPGWGGLVHTNQCKFSFSLIAAVPAVVRMTTHLPACFSPSDSLGWKKSAPKICFVLFDCLFAFSLLKISLNKRDLVMGYESSCQIQVSKPKHLVPSSGSFKLTLNLFTWQLANKIMNGP